MNPISLKVPPREDETFLRLSLFISFLSAPRERLKFKFLVWLRMAPTHFLQSVIIARGRKRAKGE